MEYKSRILRYLDEKQRKEGTSSAVFVGLHFGPSASVAPVPPPRQEERTTQSHASHESRFSVTRSDLHERTTGKLSREFRRFKNWTL